MNSHYGIVVPQQCKRIKANTYAGESRNVKQTEGAPKRAAKKNPIHKYWKFRVAPPAKSQHLLQNWKM